MLTILVFKMSNVGPVNWTVKYTNPNTVLQPTVAKPLRFNPHMKILG